MKETKAVKNEILTKEEIKFINLYRLHPEEAISARRFLECKSHIPSLLK